MRIKRDAQISDSTRRLDLSPAQNIYVKLSISHSMPVPIAIICVYVSLSFVL